MTLAESAAYQTIAHWKRSGLRSKEAWYALTGENRTKGNWSQIARQIVKLERQRETGLLTGIPD